MQTNPDLSAQTWIDRYVHQALRYQPTSEHKAADTYVRAQIDTALKSAGASDPPTTDEVLRTLEKLGPPAQVAAGDSTPPSLIGPMLFPVFRTVLAIVLLTLTGLFIFAMVMAGATFRGAPSLFAAIGGLFSSLLQAIGMLVIIFAIIEWQTRRQAPADWKADSLPPVEDPDRISKGKTIADIAFTLAAIVIFNSFGDRIGYFNQVDGHWTILPIFGPGFMAFVPWLTALWVAEILLKTYLLTQGRWQTITRLVELLLSVVGIMLLALMLAAGNLAAQADLEPLFRLVIGIVIAVATVDAIVQVYRLVRR